ncbi:MAG: hypothetical protein ACJA2N_001098 [Salibacteraceae bacterium]|jgi:hypothetical protein
MNPNVKFNVLADYKTKKKSKKTEDAILKDHEAIGN